MSQVLVDQTESQIATWESRIEVARAKGKQASVQICEKRIAFYRKRMDRILRGMDKPAVVKPITVPEPDPIITLIEEIEAQVKYVTFLRVVSEEYDSGWMETGKADFRCLRTNAQFHVKKHRSDDARYFFFAKEDFADRALWTEESAKILIGKNNIPLAVKGRELPFRRNFPIPKNIWSCLK